MYGPGLDSGLLECAEGMFLVDTTGAGPAKLHVDVHGPKNGFDVKIRKAVDSQRIAKVTYSPTVEGIYTLNVLWGGEHVPGSPFKVFLARTDAELVRLKGAQGEIV